MNKKLFLLLLAIVLLHPHDVIGQICFTDYQYLPVNSMPTYIVAADLNNDSLPDLVTASIEFNNMIAVYLNNGNRSFSLQEYYTPTNTPTQICIKDMNADNIPDMVVGMRYFGFDIFFGQGNGAFDSVMYYHTGYWTSAIVVEDFNSDSIPDVATTCTWDDSLRIYTGDSAGVFTFAGAYTSGGNTPTVIHQGDFNHDDIWDLAVLNSGDAGSGYRNVAVFMGVGSAQFDDPVIYTLNIDPTSLDVADFNMDSADDFVVGYSLYWPKLMFGNGDGTFDNSGYQDTVGLGTKSIFAGDVNMDGIPDLISPDRYVSVALGYGDGTFCTSVNLPSDYNYCAAYYGCMADFDRDGKNDLASVNQNAYEFEQPGKTVILYNCISIGFDENVSSGNVCVFPNPVADQLSLSLSGSYACDRIQIYNSMQQLVLDEPFTNGGINTKNLSPGIYFIQLFFNHNPVAQSKFIKT